MHVYMISKDQAGGFCISIPSFIILCTGKHQGLLVILKYVMNCCRQQLPHFSIKHRKSFVLFTEYTNIGMVYSCVYHFLLIPNDLQSVL